MLGILVAAIAARAQQAPAGPRTLVPLAASSLLQHPDLYMGQAVALYAAVEDQLSPTTFSVDQDAAKASLNDVLIVAPTLIAPVPARAYVTIVGTVIRFDAAEIAKHTRGYTLDLAPAVIERYRGRPAIIATSVVDAEMIDLARPKPVPLTPAEEAFDRTMKQVNPASADLRRGVEASDAAVLGQRAAELRKLFEETRAFFQAREATDAVAWATEAATIAAAMEKAAGENRWDEVKASSTRLTQLCQACHAAHRERQEDGSYRVKGSR